MTTLSWNGGTGVFFAPASWTPSQSPSSGDLLVIGPTSFGTPVDVAQAQFAYLNGLTVVLDGPTGAPPQPPLPRLDLSWSIIGRTTTIAAANPPGSPPTDMPRGGEIDVHGVVLNQGTLTENTTFALSIGGELDIKLDDRAVLLNQGLISGIAFGQVNVTGGTHSTLVNNGSIGGAGVQMKFDVDVEGRGTFDFSRGSNPGSHEGSSPVVEFGGKVSAGETVNIGYTQLLLDNPLAFQGTINATHVAPPGPEGFNSSILLVGETAAALSYDMATKVLTVSGITSHILAHLHITGVPEAADFHLQNTGQGALIGISAQPAASVAEIMTGIPSGQSTSANT